MNRTKREQTAPEDAQVSMSLMVSMPSRPSVVPIRPGLERVLPGAATPLAGLAPPARGDVAALRARLRGLGTGGVGPAVPFGAPAIDRVLAGGLLRRGVHEVAAEGEADIGAATGFLLAMLNRLAPRRPVLWCRAADPASGVPYAPGVDGAGIAPDRLLLLVARRPVEALWAAEEGLRAGRIAVVVEVDALDLTASRRLQLAAEAGGGPGLVLRRRADRKMPSAALTRWRVAAAPGAGDVGIGAGIGVGLPRWRVALTRCRGGGEGEWVVEWDHATDHLAVAAELADRPLAAPARRAG